MHKLYKKQTKVLGKILVAHVDWDVAPACERQWLNLDRQLWRLPKVLPKLTQAVTTQVFTLDLLQSLMRPILQAKTLYDPASSLILSE